MSWVNGDYYSCARASVVASTAASRGAVIISHIKPTVRIAVQEKGHNIIWFLSWLGGLLVVFFCILIICPN